MSLSLLKSRTVEWVSDFVEENGRKDREGELLP